MTPSSTLSGTATHSRLRKFSFHSSKNSSTDSVRYARQKSGLSRSGSTRSGRSCWMKSVIVPIQGARAHSINKLLFFNFTLSLYTFLSALVRYQIPPKKLKTIRKYALTRFRIQQ